MKFREYMDNREQLESSIRNHEKILGMRPSDYRGASLEELRRDESFCIGN